MPLARSLKALGHHTLVDFPGFGASPTPPEIWSTEQYADFIAAFITDHIKKPVIWVGHSFGCRIGLQLARRHPELIKGLCLIAGAGLQRKRPLWQKLYYRLQVLIYKALKKLSLIGLINKDWLARKFGSADYKKANKTMRSILVKVVNEDLSAVAKNLPCPALLIYGRNDTETPPEIGERLQKLMGNAQMVHLDGQDHYTVLSGGRHQVAPLLKRFIETHNNSPK